MVPKLDYAAFRAAAQAINVGIDCDEEVAQDWETNEEFLKKVFTKSINFQ
jgi:hypothetical protein